jgi:hypothetical protein
MGSITLTVEGTTVGLVSQGRGVVIRKEVSEADSARLIAAYAKTYAGEFKDDLGKPRQPTITEVLEKWFAGIVAGSVAHVMSVEKDQARETAANAVAAITVA